MVKIWDFTEGVEEGALSGTEYKKKPAFYVTLLRCVTIIVTHVASIILGHGWDVKAVDWHPYKSLLASGSKDNLIKFWDPKSGKNVDTLYVVRDCSVAEK